MWSKIGRGLVKAAVWACGHKEVIEIIKDIVKNKGEIHLDDLPNSGGLPR